MHAGFTGRMRAVVYARSANCPCSFLCKASHRVPQPTWCCAEMHACVPVYPSLEKRGTLCGRCNYPAVPCVQQSALSLLVRSLLLLLLLMMKLLPQQLILCFERCIFCL